jgi:hypothetical protein
LETWLSAALHCRWPAASAETQFVYTYLYFFFAFFLDSFHYIDLPSFNHDKRTIGSDSTPAIVSSAMASKPSFAAQQVRVGDRGTFRQGDDYYNTTYNINKSELASPLAAPYRVQVQGVILKKEMSD